MNASWKMMIAASLSWCCADHIKALGLTIPHSVLALADQVIE
jgi:hypothetical protein